MVCRKMEKGQEKKDWLDQKYGLRRKGFTLVMEELKQRITAKANKVKQYDNRIKQFQDNRNFETNQGRFFKNLEGKEERTKPPNAEDATAFWKGICGVQKSSTNGMQNGLTKQKRRCHLNNRIQ